MSASRQLAPQGLPWATTCNNSLLVALARRLPTLSWSLLKRYELFKACTDVFAADGRSVPIFNDKRAPPPPPRPTHTHTLHTPLSYTHTHTRARAPVY